MSGTGGPDYSKDDVRLSLWGIEIIVSDTAVFVKVAGKEIRISRTDASTSEVHNGK